jgi:tetratricopeptide (TPR) repeat protein
LEFKPDYAAAHNGLGIAFGSLGKYDEAIASYAKALEYDPDCEKAHNNLGNVLLAVGKHNEAFASYARALELDPHDAVAHKNLCAVKKYKKGDPQVAQMLEIIADPAISRSDKMQLSFALGKAYDDMGDAESSFQHLMEGNRLRKQELGYDIGSDRREFGRIKSIFETGDLPTLDTNQPVTEWAKRPIFIIGMLRSGTTLTEQILASHSQVYGGGELGTLTEVVLPILNAAQESSGFELESRQIKAVRDGYLAELNGLGAEERFVTDKMPLNFRWVGFILTAIPEAKIIKLQRDPVATCWSIYKHYFSKDGNGYAYDLEDVAEYYKMYCDLMNYWRCIFPRQIYDLNYESLTENPEEEVRKLLEYCGLDWEDRCLEFHKNKRAVRTASSLQVRQEMYQGSSMAWRKYEKQFQPLLAALRG